MDIKLLFFCTILFFKISVNGSIRACKPTDMARSFISMKNKLSEFFRTPEEVKKLQERVDSRKTIIKVAFSNFLDEAMAKGEAGSTQVRSLKQDSRSSNRYQIQIKLRNQDQHEDKYDHYTSTTYKISTKTEPLSVIVPVRAPVIEESKMTASEMITYHGYKSQSHVVNTEDGYTLRMHRVLPVSPDSVEDNKKLALLHHGLWGSSEDWLLLGPEKALPYMLSAAGYDVWLTNARGNIYSRLHTKYNVDSKIFWDFSFHEMGVYDLPAVIDYIRNIRGNDSKITFVGHSMGGTALLVLLSTLPEYNRVMKSATLLAPLAFMYQIKGPLKLLAELHGVNDGISLNFLGENEFMPIENFPAEVIEKYCRGDGKLCWNPLLLLASGGKIILDNVLLRNVLGHIPAGISAKTIAHYLQLVKSGKFQMYDGGVIENLKIYGLRTPSSYNLSYIKLPLILFSSRDDWLCTMPDMLTMLPDLPNVVTHHIVKRYDFSHTDFVWGEDAPELIFSLIIDILRRDNVT